MTAKHEHQCHLLAGFFTYLMQLLLGIAALSTLIVKVASPFCVARRAQRFQEKPRRDWMTWGRDASKQAVSALIAHGWNMLFAIILSVGDSDPCTFYMVNYFIDSFAGVRVCTGVAMRLIVFKLIFIYMLLKFVEFIAKEKLHTNKLQSGYYGNPPQNSIWFLQLCVWVTIITVVKWFLLFAVIWPLRSPLYQFGNAILGPTKGDPDLELTIVMVLGPFAANVICFWVTDAFLKWSQKKRLKRVQKAEEKKQAPREDTALLSADYLTLERDAVLPLNVQLSPRALALDSPSP